MRTGEEQKPHGSKHSSGGQGGSGETLYLHPAFQTKKLGHGPPLEEAVELTEAYASVEASAYLIPKA